MGTHTSSGAAAAHLDDAGQAAIDQTLAASAIVEELGSMRPDRFSFSLRSGRCQWEKEDLPAGKRNRNGRDGPCHVELTKAAQHRAGWTIAPTWRRLPAGAQKPQQPSVGGGLVSDLGPRRTKVHVARGPWPRGSVLWVNMTRVNRSNGASA